MKFSWVISVEILSQVRYLALASVQVVCAVVVALVLGALFQILNGR